MRARAVRSILTLVIIIVGIGTVAASQPPAPAATGVISGRVLNEKGEGFGFVDVALEGVQGSTYLDSLLTEWDGSFRFTSVPVGSYWLIAFTDGSWEPAAMRSMPRKERRKRKKKDDYPVIGVTAGSSRDFTITLAPIHGGTADVIVQ